MFRLTISKKRFRLTISKKRFKDLDLRTSVHFKRN